MPQLKPVKVIKCLILTLLFSALLLLGGNAWAGTGTPVDPNRANTGPVNVEASAVKGANHLAVQGESPQNGGQTPAAQDQKWPTVSGKTVADLYPAGSNPWFDKKNLILKKDVKLPDGVITEANFNIIKSMTTDDTPFIATGVNVGVSQMKAALLGNALDTLPKRTMHEAEAEGQAQATQAGDAAADTARGQAASAISFCSSYLENFTTQPQWNLVRDQIFVPMAILLLLPGAVLAQARAIVAAGSPVLGEVNPFEGILRSIVAIFLIPATALVVNYGIDLNNSIAFTINTEYARIFGSDMYRDALCAELRATPVRQTQSNANDLAGQTYQGKPMLGSMTPFGKFEGALVENSIQDPCAGINQAPAAAANENMSSGMAATRMMMNGSNASLAAAWNILCAFQLAYLYYLWCVGPIMAALWVYPLRTLRNALPSWCEGVITLCFWSLFWNTVILLIACFKGVDETGTMITTALNFLATASVKYAFDFAGLVKAAGQEAAGMAAGAAQHAAQQGGGGGGAASKGGSRGASSGAGGRSAGAHGGGAQLAANHGSGGRSTGGHFAGHNGNGGTGQTHQDGQGGSSTLPGVTLASFHPNQSSGLQPAPANAIPLVGNAHRGAGGAPAVEPPPITTAHGTHNSAEFHFDQAGHMLDAQGNPMHAYALDQNGKIIGSDLTASVDQNGNYGFTDSNGNPIGADATIALVDNQDNIFTGNAGSLTDDGSSSITLDGEDGQNGVNSQTREALLAAAAADAAADEGPPMANDALTYETDEGGNVYAYLDGKLDSVNGQPLTAVSMAGEMNPPPNERQIGPTPQNIENLRAALQEHGVRGVDPSGILASIQRGGTEERNAAHMLRDLGFNSQEAGQYFARSSSQLTAFADQSTTSNSSLQNFLNQYGDQGVDALMKNQAGDAGMSSLLAYTQDFGQTNFSPTTINDGTFPTLSAMPTLNQTDLLTSFMNPATLPTDLAPGGLERLHPGTGIEGSGTTTVAGNFSSITGSPITGEFMRPAVDGAGTGMTGPAVDRIGTDLPVVSNGTSWLAPGGSILDIQSPGVNPGAVFGNGGSIPDPSGITNSTVTSNSPMVGDGAPMQSITSGTPMQVPDTIVSTSFDGQPGPINTGSVPIFNEGTSTGYVSSPIVNPTVFGSSPEGTSVVSNFSGGDTFSYPSTANATQGTFSEVSGSWAPTATSQTISEGTPGGGIVTAGSGWGTQVSSESGPVGTPTQTVEVIPTTGVGSVNTSVPTFNSGGGTFESTPGGMQVNQSPAVSGDMISAFNSQTSNAWTVDNPGTPGGSTTSFFGSGGTVQADGGMVNNSSVVPVATTAFTAINEGGNNSVTPTYFGGNSNQTTSYGDITANTTAFGGNSTQTTSYGDITTNTSAPVPQSIGMPASIDPTHTNNAIQSQFSTYSNVAASDNFSPAPNYLAYQPGGTVVDNSTSSYPMFSNPPTTQEIPTMLNYGNNGVSQGAPPDVSNLTMIPNYVSNNQTPMVTEGGYAPAMPNTTEVVSNGYSGGGSYENITNSWFGTPSEPTRRVDVAGTSDLGMVPLIPNIVSHAPTAPQSTPTPTPSTRVAAIENPGSLSINPAKQPPRSVLARIIAGRSNQQNQQNGTQMAANTTRSNPANVARTGGNTPEELARYQPGGPDGDGPPPVLQAMPGSSLDQELLLANQRGGRIAKNDSEYEALMKAQLDEMTGISGMPDTGGTTSTV
jgi:hypothetical protein